jgi:serine phosphatase RsbU (regulator of sigma subunit)
MALIVEHISKLPRLVILLSSIILAILFGILDLITGVELSVSLFYLIPVAICSWYLNKWSGIIMALLCAIIWFLADWIANNSYSHTLIPYWNALILLGFFCSLAITLSELKKAINFENNLAVKVQQGLLPKQNLSIPGFKISVYWKPRSFVSGDYYDFLNIDNERFGICIGDCAGHGTAAAILMSNLQASVRLLSHKYKSTDKFCYQLNNAVLENELSGKFITFFYCLIDHKDNTFEYTNAGHPPPILIEHTGKIVKLETGGLLIGTVKNNEYKKDTIQLAVGDKIIFYTDGIIESRNPSGALYDEERLINTCLINISLNAEELSKKIIQSVSEFSNNIYDDDITLMILEVQKEN